MGFGRALGLTRQSEENDLSQTAGSTTEANLTFTQLDEWLKSGERCVVSATQGGRSNST